MAAMRGQDFEGLGTFYLGKGYDLERGARGVREEWRERRQAARDGRLCDDDRGHRGPCDLRRDRAARLGFRARPATGRRGRLGPRAAPAAAHASWKRYTTPAGAGAAASMRGSAAANSRPKASVLAAISSIRRATGVGSACTPFA